MLVQERPGPSCACCSQGFYCTAGPQETPREKTRTATQEAGEGHSKDAQAETEGAAAEEEITKTEGLVLETVKEESETSSH